MVSFPGEPILKRPGTSETYTAFHPDYLKEASEALEKLVRSTCIALPVREERTLVRNKREYQRDGWWAL